MRVYIITEAEMDSLRSRCELAFMEACAKRSVNPHLMGTPENDLWRAFNFHFCRWKSEVGATSHKGIMPEEPTQ